MTSLVKSFTNIGGKDKSKKQNDMCDICGQRPKYVEGNGFQHPFCSRKCAANVSSPVPCALRGCRGTGNRILYAGFCSEIHAREAVRLRQVAGCTNCKAQPATVGDLCAMCDRRARAGPLLVELDARGVAFKSVTDHFYREWANSSTPVSIQKIYEVKAPRDVISRYEAQSKKLGSTGHGVQELSTFHSSQCICDLGTADSVLCSFPACGICNIVKSSFGAFAFGVAQNSGRYGAGVYSYLSPTLADEFATSCTTSPYRVMIQCDVLMSSASKRRRGTESINDGERIFVSNADAIQASYVIMYTK